MTFNGRRHFWRCLFVFLLTLPFFFYIIGGMFRIVLMITIFFCSTSRSDYLQAQTTLFQIENGKAHFISEAPLEIIEATSEELRGLIDTEKRTFAFAVKMRSFQGFNSPLQQEHFNENYMESHRYPEATFTGKIIESIDFSQDGNYTIRAKGGLNIHGVEQERIIKSQLKIDRGKLFIKSAFTILLEEHDISIPRIVFQKIAQEIKIEVNAELTP